MPTTQISLIRLHTEKTRPPRALWVPFELGRPLGAPDAPFQKRVLLAALRLLESPDGPVLEDFPEDAPASANETTALACPVNFAQDAVDLTETGQLCAAFKREIAAMRPWYDIAVEKRGHTTVGVSQLDIGAIVALICSFLEGARPENPRDDISLPNTLKFAVDDLKAFYAEGVTAQPGQEFPSSQVLSDWFWGETVAARVLLAVRDVCATSKDTLVQRVGTRLIVPSEVLRRRAG
mgnify:FL=1